MKVGATAFTVWGLLFASVAFAQEPGAPASPPKEVRLLDDVPNYAEILVHQWSAGTPEDAIEAERSTEHYGRLLETQPPQARTLADCIAMALQNNTNLQVQRLGPLTARAQVQRARAIFDAIAFGHVTRDRTTSPANNPLSSSSALTAPNLQTIFTQNFSYDAGVRKTFTSGGQLSLAYSTNRQLANPSIINLLVPKYTTTLGLSLNQPLLRDFGWRYSLLLVEVAENTEQAAYHQYKANIATLISQVERAYWGLVLAIEQVQVQEHGLALARELLRQNEGKFKVGALPRTAVLEAQAEVAQREATLLQVANFRDNARDTLRALINSPEAPGGNLIMIDPQDKPTTIPYQIDLERSLNTAIEQRPELIAARLAVHTQGLQRKAAENQLLPRLNFAGQLGVNGLSGGRPAVPFLEDPQTGQPILNQAPQGLEGNYGRALELLVDGRFYNYSAGASIEIPLGNSQAKADYTVANINLEQAKLSLQALQENVTLEIKHAVSNLSTDLKSIDATRIARELAEENVRNQQARYDVGLATTKDMLDFQDKLTRARAAEVLALTTYQSDLAEMHRVEGTLLAERNVVVERASATQIPWWESF